MTQYNMTDMGFNESLAYPVEFELRVIHEINANLLFVEQLGQLLSEHGVSMETPRPVPTKGDRYGRLACKVRFESKEAMYKAYEEAAKIPGVKTII
ncbi:hypothetical protein MASR2M29_06460 [Spirochaetota bacterium]